MEERIITFSANQQSLIKTGGISHYASDTVSYIKAIFDLGENWTGFDEVRAVFKTPYDTRVAVLNSLGECEVPHEILMLKAEVRVNLVGSIYTEEAVVDRLTTYSCEALEVDEDVPVEGMGTVTPSPSEYEGFVAKVKNDANRAEAGATNAEASAQNASDSATSAHNSAESAHDDKIAIEEAIAEVIQQIEDFEQVQVVVNTLPPSSQATSDFTNGVLTLGIPQGVKGDTGNGIQSIAKVSTSGLVDTYRITYTDGQTTTFTVTNGAKGDTGNGISSIAKTSTVGLVDTYTITYTDGTTSTFTVTNGEKGDKGDTGEVSLNELEDATIVQTLSDNEPYHFRRTNNGNGSGTREYDEIVGASVGWNQLVNWDNIARTKYGVTGTISNNRLIFNGTATATDWTAAFGGYVDTNVSPVEGHKYYVCGLKKSSDDAYVTVGGKSDGVYPLTFADVWRFYVKEGVTYTNYTFEINIFDLTLFNSQIADYVYSLEQSTAGSGVTWLKQHFPIFNSYQPFDDGSVKSIEGLSAHKMVGVNQWDEVWENGTFNTTTGANINTTSALRQIRSKNLIPVIPNAVYYINATKPIWCIFYDADMNVIVPPKDGDVIGWDGNSLYLGDSVRPASITFTMLSEARYMKFYCVGSYGSTYTNDICINLSDTSINGQYFPHEKHTYPLDSSVTLRGQYKLDANNNLYADGDVWKSSGEIDRNWSEEVDLGTLEWTYNAGGGSHARLTATISDIALPTNENTIADIVCDKYVPATMNNVYANAQDKTIAVHSSAHAVWIYDSSYTDAQTFTQAVSGSKIVYRKTTSTTETATPYTSPQWCDSHGTEEYVGSELPVGHSTDYPMTLIDTADGLSNGTYEPRITVANGKKTVTWVSV